MLKVKEMYLKRFEVISIIGKKGVGYNGRRY